MKIHVRRWALVLSLGNDVAETGVTVDPSSAGSFIGRRSSAETVRGAADFLLINYRYAPHIKPVMHRNSPAV